MFVRKGKARILATVITVALVMCSVAVVRSKLQYHPAGEVYVCRHMARDIERMLEPLGFNVTCVVGGLPENNSYKHMWVKINGIPVDSVTLIPFANTQRYCVDVKEYDEYPYHE